MATKRVTFEVDLPPALLDSFESPEAVSRQAKEAFVIELLRQEKLSQGKAAEILQLDRWQLMDLLRTHEVPAAALSAAELQEERKRWAAQRESR